MSKPERQPVDPRLLNPDLVEQLYEVVEALESETPAEDLGDAQDGETWS